MERAHELRRSADSHVAAGVRSPARRARTLPALSTPEQLLSLQARAGNRAVARVVAGRGRMIARLAAMIQPGYATGDQFAIAATLVNQTDLHVFITAQPADAKDRDARGQAEKIQQFYLESGVPARRIHIVETAGLADSEKARDKALVELQKLQPDFKKEWIKRVNYATQYIAEHFTASMRTQTRQAWHVDSTRDAQIRSWLGTKGIQAPTTKGGKALVIWSRFSGKKGEIHLEHDTSYQGVREIIDLAKPSYDLIVIAGDSGWATRHKGKYAQIAADANSGLTSPKVFDITEFWNVPVADKPALAAWGGNTRTGQFKLYDFLHRFYNLKHLGFRSGNLEAMALLGHKVLYMEEAGSSSGDRMASWHAAHDSTQTTRQQGSRNASSRRAGIAPGYERLVVNKVPTRTGQHLKYLETEERHNWSPHPWFAPGVRGTAPKPASIENEEWYSPGFAPEDLAAIDEYLNA